MTIRLHELHPALVHLPLSFVPVAALFDVAALSTGSRRLSWMGNAFWIASSASALATGIAGMASSQEVKVPSAHARQQMFLHGFGNLAISGAALGLTLWRARHRPSLGSTLFGLSGWVAAMYTGYLGGQLVYHHGLGVAPADGTLSEEVSPPLFSGKALARLWVDAAKGLGWLLGQFGRLATRQERLEPGVSGISREPLAPSYREPPEVYPPPPM